jgi:signal transduction histidine kinase
MGDVEAAAIENARLAKALRDAEARYQHLFEQARTSLAETQALYRAITVVTSTLHQDEAIERILEQLACVVPYDSATVQLLREGYLEIVGGHGWPDLSHVIGVRFPIPGNNPNTTVIQKRQPFILGNAPSVYSTFEIIPSSAHIRSWLGVPLIVHDHIIGMMALDSDRPDYFTPDHARLVQAFAAQAAIAIENARLFESERVQLRLAQTLQEVGALLTTRMNLEEVFECLFDLLAQVVQYDSVSIQLLNDAGGVEIVAGRGFPDLEQARQAARVVASQTLEERFDGARVVVIPDTYSDSRWITGLGAEYIRSWIGASLIVRGALVGILNVDSATVNAYTTAAGEMVAAFANQAAVAIENARLFEEAQQEIAERKQAEAEREALITELEAKNAELERFVYTVSHDLKSPLITIRGFLGFLEQDVLAGDMAGVKTDMARIIGATDKMQQLLTELLELSRIGRLMNPPEQVSLGDLAREAVEMVQGRLEEAGVIVEIAPDLPMVYGDRSRLREVLENLVDNAVKYMGDQPDPRVEIGMRRAGEESVFFVRDNGIGIEPRYHEKVFGLFERLDIIGN